MPCVEEVAQYLRGTRLLLFKSVFNFTGAEENTTIIEIDETNSGSDRDTTAIGQNEKIATTVADKKASSNDAVSGSGLHSYTKVDIAVIQE